MPEYQISGAAIKDLKEIAIYTFNRWGEEQMREYMGELLKGCELLAARPAMGRSCDSLAPGLRRFELKKHVLFYLQEPEQIAVIRILHQRTLPIPELFL